MSKTEILTELLKLAPWERREIVRRIFEWGTTRRC
jgi:hypothetical protein